MKSESKVYRLSSGRKPMTLMVATKHSRSKELQWLDPQKQELRALRYATNHASIFEDEQKGEARLGRIVFLDGSLVVPNRNLTLIKFMEMHPDNIINGGNLFEEMDHEAEAKLQVESMDLEFEAQQLSRQLTMSQVEAVMRKLNPSQVDKMYHDEMKRDVRVFAKKNPAAFMDMVEDPDVEMDNIVSNLIEAKLIQFRKNNTEVWYTMPDNKKLLFRVPEGQDPMNALNDYFVYDNEGVQKYKDLLEFLEN